jgi:hypothetical protein
MWASFSFLEKWERRRESLLAITRAAFHLLRRAVRVFAHKLALWLRARRLLTLPITLRLLTDSFTHRRRSLTARQTVWLVARNNALRALGVATSFRGALMLAHGFLTFNVAQGVGGFRAGSVAFGWFTYWFAYGRAFGIVAFPSALRATLFQERS